MRQRNFWPLRCSWSIACRRCSNYIFILDLTPGFNILRKDNCKTRRDTFKFWDLVRLILEIWRYSYIHSIFFTSIPNGLQICQCQSLQALEWIISIKISIFFFLSLFMLLNVCGLIQSYLELNKEHNKVLYIRVNCVECIQSFIINKQWRRELIREW